MVRLSRWFMAALVGGSVMWVGWAIAAPLLPTLDAVGTVVTLAATLWALHKAAQWAESRGWIYYQKRHGSWDAVGAALSEVQSMYQPGQRHVKELKEDAHVFEEEDDLGEGR
jgi:hypothetical protein